MSAPPPEPLRSRCERGSATVELAIALPAVVVVLLAGLGATQLAARQVGLADAAADAARSLARGEGDGAALAAARAHVGDARLSIGTGGDGLVCARLASSGRVLGVPVELASRGCALDGGR